LQLYRSVSAAMNIHRLYALVQRITPSGLYIRLRQIVTALLTPIRFSIRTGHFRSSLKSASFASDGEIIPWYTFPAIDLLSQKEFKDRSILEFGSGNSTIWWARRASSVVALENDRKWCDKISGMISANVSLHYIADYGLQCADQVIGTTLFDIIVIDGFDRFKAAQIAVQRLAEHGAIIVDNAEGYWGAEGTHPIMDLLRHHGFSRADFYGFAPGVLRRHCTSIAFRRGTFLFDGIENPKQFDPRS
jgi:hypothetical protein